MRQFLDRVVITGADNSTCIQEMIEITKRYPFVEWGILLSNSSMGRARFPDLEWMQKLYERKNEFQNWDLKLPFSGHLCGRWVRDICKGEWNFVEELESVYQMFTRYQLNFHSYLHKIKDEAAFLKGFRSVHPYTSEFVFQLDDVNNKIVDIALESISAQPFFDLSGGIGKLPEKWDKAREGVYTGYAGGLSPENVHVQLEKIEEVCGNPTWVDVETHVRTLDNQALDMEKVKAFLSACEPWLREDWVDARGLY